MLQLLATHCTNVQDYQQGKIDLSNFLICGADNVVKYYGKRIKILHHCPFRLDFVWYKVATWQHISSLVPATVLTFSCCHPVIPHRNTNVSDNQRTPVCSFHFPVSVKLLAPYQLLLWRDVNSSLRNEARLRGENKCTCGVFCIWLC